MTFELNYDNWIHLDAEELAEGGLKAGYASIVPNLRQYVAEPDEVLEVADPSAPRYFVSCRGVNYPIYSPELPEGERQSWGRAAHVLFKIVNDQLAESEYRMYAINGGNDLGAMFLTQSDFESARLSLPRPEDWPYLPTLDHPWYGQAHN